MLKLLSKLLTGIFLVIIPAFFLNQPSEAVDPSTCPSFSNFEPPSGQILKNQNVKALFLPATDSDPLAQNPYSYIAKVDDNNSLVFHLQEVDATQWKAELGTYDDTGWHTMEWFFAPNTLPPTPAVKCGQYQFEVVDSVPGAGQNPCPGGQCETALGTIPTDPSAFAKRILNLAIGVAGGLALILMVIGSVRVLTSSGNQQSLSAGRDMIVAAIAGLLFLILSVLILRFIGVEIIQIPGFG